MGKQRTTNGQLTDNQQITERQPRVIKGRRADRMQGSLFRQLKPARMILNLSILLMATPRPRQRREAPKALQTGNGTFVLSKGPAFFDKAAIFATLSCPFRALL